MRKEAGSATGFAIPGFEATRVLHESKSRIVYLAVRQGDSRQVVLKALADPYPQQRSVDELRREYQITSNLKIDGVIRVHSLVSYGSGNLAIEMEPFGQSLADQMAESNGVPLPLERFFAIAIDLAEILGQVHEQDLVHKDIKPDNVLVEQNSARLRLIDFSIASQLSRESQSVTLSNRMEGSLPYISPEQTGRMNRDLDYRTDYYSLGVTLFELLTGQLPFKADRALEWVHRHISQLPPAAHELNNNVPVQLSKIISKLLSKNAEDRYQSTRGLNIDLQRCRDEYARSGTVTPFDLACQDVPRKFQIPQELYGRELPLEQLAALFDDVAHGALALCLVSGHSGVGKSAIVNELAKSIIRQRGNLIRYSSVIGLWLVSRLLQTTG